MAVPNPNYCLIVYPACVDNPSPIYIFAGKGAVTDMALYNTFGVFGDWFIEINLPGFSGIYYSAGFCPAIIGEECVECSFNPSHTIVSDDITVLAQKNEGETCYGSNCIILENCENNALQIIVPPNFNAYLGSVLKIEEYPGCWEAKYNTGNCVAAENVTVTQVCEDCVTCLPVIEPDIPRVIPQYFEDFTQTAEDQCEIDTNVKFANAYWELFKSLKHGIQSVCDTVDLDKITIQKREIDLAKLYDATACVISTPAPEPEVCVEPTGVPLPTPTPQTLWTYKADTIANCCLLDYSCQSNCTAFENSSNEGYVINFTVSQPITQANLPMIVLYEGCCLKISNIFDMDPDLTTFDFTQSFISYNTTSCTACQS